MTRKFKQTEIGKIPEDWEIVKLSDVAVVNNLTLNDSFPYEEIEYIDISSVAQGRISETKLLQRSEAPSRAQRVVRDNDILLSTVRPNLKHYAFIKKAKSNIIASTGFAVITSKNIHPQFLYYYISTDRYTYYLSAIADMHTSAYPACNPDVIENSLMPYPPLPEQRAIAKILSDLDEKIELNRQTNKTLESIAKAIFKHWFVDFEFPNEEGKPYKSSGGKMVDSELGDIPKDWDVNKVKNFGAVVCGKTPPKSVKKYFGGDIPFIKIPDMHNQPLIIKTEDSLSIKGKSYQENKTIPNKSICVSCIATVGLVALTSMESQTNQQINSIIPADQNSTYFLYCVFKRMRRYLEDLGSGGSATLNINTTSFSNIRINKPEKDILRKFDEV
ncbi:MAG: restriction endonuclease subunit S, partial [bacterium]